MSSAIEKEVKILNDAKLRATTQRVALLRTLHRARKPQSAEALAKSVRGALDVATVYRTLNTFIETGLVRQVELATGRALFELAGEHHHHVVCTTCNRIEDVHVCLPEEFTSKVRKAAGFALVSDHALEFFGTCKKCMRTV
jgi:Fe2+ or Zn2+ uptake regulation protein